MAAGGYGLLGPVEVRVDGRALPLPGARQRLLLAVLLVNANRMVPAVRLIDELWGADLPADPRAALRTQVARLRRALGPAGEDLATLEGGYRLTVPRSGLDFCRFEDALAEAARANGESALRLLDEAVALCRGPALGEFADRPFALATAARLEELRVAAAERQAGLRLSLGRVEEAVAALRALLAEHPEREQARGLLMQALYRAGQAHRSPGHQPVVAPAPGHRTRAGPLPRPAGDRAGHLAPHGRDAGYPRRGRDRGRCRCR